MLEKNGEYHSEAMLIKNGDDISLKAFVEVVDMSTYSSSVTISILDKLLDSGKITLEQYISRIPQEYIENSTDLVKGENPNE
jgi:hypothetical protein